eukprot:364399-Chlamydomonas_euryale.AAC.4
MLGSCTPGKRSAQMPWKSGTSCGRRSHASTASLESESEGTDTPGGGEESQDSNRIDKVGTATEVTKSGQQQK